MSPIWNAFFGVEDLEWKIIYVGSAESEECDQTLDSVLVGPVPAGRHMFVFQVSVDVPVWESVLFSSHLALFAGSLAHILGVPPYWGLNFASSLTGRCSESCFDTREWRCWRYCGSNHLHIPWTGVHPHWVLCEQWVHPSWAAGRPTYQARLHTGSIGIYLCHTHFEKQDLVVILA